MPLVHNRCKTKKARSNVALFSCKIQVLMQFAFTKANEKVYNSSMEKDLTEQTVQQNLIYDGKIIRLYRDDITLPNGQAAVREYVSHPGGAAVLPIDDEGNVYLVRQFRYPYRTELLEVPAGKLEQNEAPQQAAIRELEEETGLRAGDVRELGVFYPTPGYTDERLHIYLATHLVQGNMHLDSDEFVSVIKIPFDEVLQMVLSNTIKDGKTCFAVMRYALER